MIRPTDYPLTVTAPSEDDARGIVDRRARDDGFRVVRILRSYRSVMPGQWTVVLSVIPAPSVPTPVDEGSEVTRG